MLQDANSTGRTPTRGQWFNSLPGWILDDPPYSALSPVAKGIVDGIGHQCTSPKGHQTQSLVGAFTGAGLFERCHVARRTFQKHLPRLVELGYVGMLAWGGMRKGWVFGSTLGVPGRRGELDAYIAPKGAKPMPWPRNGTSRLLKALDEACALEAGEACALEADAMRPDDPSKRPSCALGSSAHTSAHYHLPQGIQLPPERAAGGGGELSPAEAEAREAIAAVEVHGQRFSEMYGSLDDAAREFVAIGGTAAVVKVLAKGCPNYRVFRTRFRRPEAIRTATKQAEAKPTPARTVPARDVQSVAAAADRVRSELRPWLEGRDDTGRRQALRGCHSPYTDALVSTPTVEAILADDGACLAVNRYRLDERNVGQVAPTRQGSVNRIRAGTDEANVNASDLLEAATA